MGKFKPAGIDSQERDLKIKYTLINGDGEDICYSTDKQNAQDLFDLLKNHDKLVKAVTKYRDAKIARRKAKLFPATRYAQDSLEAAADTLDKVLEDCCG